jgi:threonine dehydrogenase-like Zn-dependent dehydrogenase
MRALCWHGKKDIRCDTVPDPQIEHPRDAIVKVTSCAICGSDLHLFDGFVPGMKHGDILGHEFMGEVMEVGAENKKLKVGDRVVVPFTICCGECEQCRRGNWSVCERTNRNKAMADKLFGHSTAGLFGYTHLTGGYAGGDAEFVRVPYADVAPVKINGHTDEQVLFLGDILPTGWQAAMQCDIQPEDTVAVWGAGPVGQFAIRSAVLLGAKQVIAIDRVPERLSMAQAGGAIPINFEEESVIERLQELTQGKGPEKCIDAVGLEAHLSLKHADSILDRAKQAVMMESDRPHVLREMMYVCRPAGVLSIPGVYGGLVDKIPFGALMQKGLTVRTGQTHVSRWAADLLRMIEEGKIDPTFVITHTVPLEEGPAMFETFRDKKDGCVKVVMKP